MLPEHSIKNRLFFQACKFYHLMIFRTGTTAWHMCMTYKRKMYSMIFFFCLHKRIFFFFKDYFMAYVIENTSREGRVLLCEPKCSVALFIENSWWLTYASWSIFIVHINTRQKVSTIKETLNILDKMNWLVDVGQACSAATPGLAKTFNNEAVKAAEMKVTHGYLQPRLPLLPLNVLPATDRDQSCALSIALVFKETNWSLGSKLTLLDFFHPGRASDSFT